MVTDELWSIGISEARKEIADIQNSGMGFMTPYAHLVELLDRHLSNLRRSQGACLTIEEAKVSFLAGCLESSIRDSKGK